MGGIILRDGSAECDPDPAEFRSLASDSEGIELETTWNTTFGEGARVPSLSLNANLDRSFSRSLSGLDTVLLTDPDGNSQLRAIDDDPITRRTRSTTASLGSSFNAPIDDSRITTLTDAGFADAYLTAGLPECDPMTGIGCTCCVDGLAPLDGLDDLSLIHI